MDLAAYVAVFKSLSKQLQRQAKIRSVYDFFILDDTSVNQRYFYVSVVYKSSPNLRLILASVENTDRYRFRFLRTMCF